MLINSLSTIIVPFWTKYILQKKLFTAHKKPFTLQFLWNPSMCWCFKEFTNKYINSTQSQACWPNPPPRELISGPLPQSRLLLRIQQTNAPALHARAFWELFKESSHPQAIQDVDEFVSSSELIWRITCSPMDPLQWMGAVRMRVQTADKNIT